MSPTGRREYQELAVTYSLPSDHIQAQVAALAAAKLFVEGLRRVGRNLSRLKLVDGLEALHKFDTGVSPPLTYGPNRRIGARGAHLIRVDLANQIYVPVGDGWFDVQ